MNASAFSESVMEAAVLSWFQNVGYSQALLEVRLRDALLPELISGELRVKDAERFVENAL